VLDAVLWIAVAWDEINPKSTIKWFANSGFVVVLYQTTKKT
jgi:hypothetical protein